MMTNLTYPTETVIFTEENAGQSHGWNDRSK